MPNYVPVATKEEFEAFLEKGGMGRSKKEPSENIKAFHEYLAGRDTQDTTSTNVVSSISPQDTISCEPVASVTPELGLRYNYGKPRFDLLPPEWIKGLTELLTGNLSKYPERNFEKGMKYSDLIRAILSHTVSLAAGNNYDVDPTRPDYSPHEGLAIAWNALTLYMCHVRGIGVDDRVKSASSS